MTDVSTANGFEVVTGVQDCDGCDVVHCKRIIFLTYHIDRQPLRVNECYQMSSTSPPTKKEQEHLSYNPKHPKPLKIWARGIAIRQTSHSNIAEKFYRREKFLTTLSVALTALTSSAIFTSISPRLLGNEVHGVVAENDADATPSTTRSTLSFYLACLAGIVAAGNTVLQAVHKSLNYAQVSEQHYIAFKRFTKMRYRLEAIVGNSYEDDGHVHDTALKNWIHDYGDVLESSPIIPQDEFAKSRIMELKNEEKYLLKSENEEERLFKLNSNESNNDVDEETQLL